MRTLLLLLLGACPGVAAGPIPVLIDTDIGSYVDDAFALGLALASPELDVKAITTVCSEAEDRAWIVCRFLSHSQTRAMPVAFGRDPQPKSDIDWQIQYRRHPAAIFNRTHKPSKDSAVTVLYQQLQAAKGEAIIIALGPLTNIAALLKEHPDAAKLIKRLFLMGGSINVGYDGKKEAEAEWNIKTDIKSAQFVFGSGLPMSVVPLDATATVKLSNAQRDRVFAARTPLTYQMQSLYELWDQDPIILFDSAAVAALVKPGLFKWSDAVLMVDDAGMTKLGKGNPTAKVAMSVKNDDFTTWFVERIRQHGQETLPTAPKNVTTFVPQGKFPARVHVFEDYNTDIENRWWMCGKAETKDVPPNGQRACRAVLTQDFDDRQGQLKTSYRAVIFNPVPGPPMGAHTRLSFRYKLTGSDKLRVQLYSLTNGYHRYLSLENVPLGEWREATVDMTQMRRPDGTGGPLAADERIDDIQFYVDPRAELLIDDVILYEAAKADETRPFPKRILFTGWFDTGKQGKEWPGEFAILPHTKPRTWKFAQSITDKEGQSLLRVHLRGDRTLAAVNELTFQYQLTGGNDCAVELEHRKNGVIARATFKSGQAGTWQTAHLRFDVKPIKESIVIDAITFRLPKGATLQIDDLLLYEPARP